VNDDAVRDLARDLGHLLAHCREEHLRRPVRIRTWRKERRHQGVPVELAFELQGRSVVPGLPDGAQGQDVFAHATGGMRPRHRKSLLDMRLDLTAEAEDEPAVRHELQIVGRVSQHHRRACERHRDAGAELDAVRVLGGERERKECVVAGLRGEEAVVAEVFELFGPPPDLARRATHRSCVHFHEGRR
jgi:hypothetical protein